MKFVIEVEDFYIEEGELAESLKNFIKTEIANAIYKTIKDQVTALIDTEFKEQVSQQLEIRVDTLIKEISASHKIKGRYSSDPDLSIAEYIESIFQNTNMKSKTDDLIINNTTKLANSLANEMKQRYDMLFASQLVQKMNEVGLLKENVANILLEKKSEQS